MSIEKNHGLFIPTCDECCTELQAEATYDDAITAKMRAGWIRRIFMKTGEKHDVCRECLKEERRAEETTSKKA